MKKTGLLFMLVLFALAGNSQVIINEISYNPPESGSDSLEFIELFNAGPATVDVSGWYFTQGVNDTFPAGTSIPAGAYFVVAINAQAMQNVYGVDVRQWTDGALSNGGEDIAIVDASGTLIDSIDYENSGDWVSGPAGNGPSLELCLTATDNAVPSNWLASTNGTGVVINGNEVFGTPGAANSVACPAVADHFVVVSSNVFTPADITINVGETVQWDNTGGTHNVNGTLTTYPDNPEGFGNGTASSASWTYSYTFNTPGVYDYQCDPHVGIGMVGTITVLPAAPADLVITEIMYNNPGTDDFEFIELYNRGSEAADLSGYTFTKGVDYTFPALSLEAGEYIVVALNAANLANTFGVTALEWTDGNLVNGGEEIVLTDGNGVVIDSVDYDDANGWAAIADGEGPSLILCDVNADNADAANWSFSTTNTGVGFGFLGNIIFASPGAANGSCATTPYVFVDGTMFSATEGSTVTVGVNLASIGAMDTTDVTFAVEATSSATEGVDFTINNPTFGIGGTGVGSWESADLSIDLIDDTEDEFDETIELTLIAASNGVTIGTSTFTVTIEDNDGIVYEEYDIAEVTTNNADGVADSLGINCELQGVVHGVDLSGSETLQFTLIDETGGIGVFSSNEDYGYTVTEGDEIRVFGEITQFNGLTQIEPDTIIFLSAGNDLVTPLVVTDLNETTESELIRINGLTIVDPADWTGSGSGFNVDVTDGVNTYTMRIDNEVDLYAASAPVGTFDLIGIGGQFDSSSPFTSGYQILPRYTADIIQNPADQINAVDDSYSTEVNTALNMAILDNDQTPNGVTSITIMADNFNGSLGLETDNTITFTPPMDYCGTQSFEYIICDATTACDTATVTIETICPTVYPSYPISVVTTVDQDGVADSLNVNVEISGIVYGVDLQGSDDNIQFTLIDPVDPDAGIGLFSGGNTFGYTVTEGDELVVRGRISQFNGLTQINPDTLFVVSTGNTLHDPEVVTVLNESTESKLVTFEGMSFVDPSQWDNMGSGMNIDITDGVNTITMRIDNDVDLFGMAIPGFSTFNVTGIGGQFDSSSPFTEGYQLLPRYMEDIEEVVSVVDPTIATQVDYFPNPVSETLVINTTTSMQRIQLTNIFGQVVYDNLNPERFEEVNMSSLASGMYVLTFTNNDRIWSASVVKK